MKRRTIRWMASNYDKRYLTPITQLKGEDAETRVMLAFWAGFEAGQRRERQRVKRKK
jgi:hypothetical protein